MRPRAADPALARGEPVTCPVPSPAGAATPAGRGATALAGATTRGPLGPVGPASTRPQGFLRGPDRLTAVPGRVGGVADDATAALGWPPRPGVRPAHEAVARLRLPGG
jgi:hypothetical protein